MIHGVQQFFAHPCLRDGILFLLLVPPNYVAVCPMIQTLYKQVNMIGHAESFTETVINMQVIIIWHTRTPRLRCSYHGTTCEPHPSRLFTVVSGGSEGSRTGVGGVTVTCITGQPVVEVRPTNVGREGETETVHSSSKLSLLRGNLEKHAWRA